MSEVGVTEVGSPAVATRPVRFVLLCDLPAKVSRAVGRTEPQRVTWRLIAANNRPLGQASTIFGSAQECIVDIERLLGSLDLATSVQLLNGAANGTETHWSWKVELNDLPAARSAHEYHRRVECERALNQFLAAVASKPSLPEVDRVRRLGDRLASSPR